MGKGKNREGSGDILATGSHTGYGKKKEGKAKKIISIIAFILAAVIVLGVVSAYGIYNSGIIQRNTLAAQSEHYEVTSAMMTYFFNSTYQTYVNGEASTYLQYMGFDTSKSLSEQKYSEDQTWFDQIMLAAKQQVQETLILAEGAYELGLKLGDKEKAEIKELLDNFDEYAERYKVTTKYYISNVYGASVTIKDIEKCLELSYLAELYHDHLMAQYEYDEADWDAYYDAHNDTFLKVDYLSYTFEPIEKEESKTEDTTAEDDTTAADEDGTDTTAAEDEDAKAEELAVLEGYANELAACKDADAFYDYVRSYLTDVVYAGKDAETLEAESVDIDELVEKCLTEGKTKSGDSDFTKWAYDAQRAPYDVFTDLHEHGDHSDYTVYMILPAKEDSDADFACMYRDTYMLKNYRYIPVKLSGADSDPEQARTMADTILDEYKEKGTEEAFAELASHEKYGDGRYEGGLIENADYKVLSETVDEWVFDPARQAGDTDKIFVENDGYYVLYFSGNGKIKWQYNADNALKNEQYSKDYSEFAEKIKVTFKTKGISLVQEVKHG